jgi:CheY-like chemotaxis protein
LGNIIFIKFAQIAAVPLILIALKKKLLIVENDTDIREVISYVLEGEGYEVVASNPKPIEKLPIHLFDVILLDEWVEKKAGHMLCTEIKAIHEAQHIPVIILSTANNIEEIAKACNADAFIRKPFALDELINVVNKCCPVQLSK